MCKTTPTRWVLVTLILILIAAGGCCRRGATTADLQPDDLAWRPYIHDDLGFSLDIPETFETRAREHGSHTRFDYRDGTPVRVLWLSEEEGVGRGLWHGRPPEAAVMIGGRNGHRYAYDHTDGPFCSRRIAYVLPHRGKELAIEFPCADDLDRVQRRVLWSLRFVPDDSGLLSLG